MIIMTLGFTGCRIGELLGGKLERDRLKGRAVLYSRHHWRIRRPGEEMIFKKPKSE